MRLTLAMFQLIVAAPMPVPSQTAIGFGVARIGVAHPLVVSAAVAVAIVFALLSGKPFVTFCR